MNQIDTQSSEKALLQKIQDCSQEFESWLTSVRPKFVSCIADEADGRKYAQYIEEEVRLRSEFWKFMTPAEREQFQNTDVEEGRFVRSLVLLKNGIVPPFWSVDRRRTENANGVYLSLLLAGYGQTEEACFPLAFILQNLKNFPNQDLLLNKLFRSKSFETRRMSYKYLFKILLGEDDAEKRLEHIMEHVCVNLYEAQDKTAGDASARVGEQVGKMLLETAIVSEIKYGHIREEDIGNIRSWLHFMRSRIDIEAMVADRAQEYFLENAREIFQRDFTENLGKEHGEEFDDFPDSKRLLEQFDTGENAKGAIDALSQNDSMKKHYFSRWAMFTRASHLAQLPNRAEKESARGILSIVLSHAGKDEILTKFRAPVVGAKDAYYSAIAQREDRKHIMKLLLEDTMDKKSLPQVQDKIVILATPNDDDVLRYWFHRDAFLTDPVMTEVLIDIFLDQDPQLIFNGTRIMAKALAQYPKPEEILAHVAGVSFLSSADLDRTVLRFRYRDLYEQLTDPLRNLLVRILVAQFSQFPPEKVEAFLPDSMRGHYKAVRTQYQRDLKVAETKVKKESQKNADVAFLKMLCDRIRAQLVDSAQRKNEIVEISDAMRIYRFHEMAEGDKYQKSMNGIAENKDPETPQTPLVDLFQKLSIKKVRPAQPGVDENMEYQWFLTGADENDTEKVIFTVQGRLDEKGSMSIEIMYKGRVLSLVTEENLQGLSSDFFQEIRYFVLLSLHQYYRAQVPKTHHVAPKKIESGHGDVVLPDGPCDELPAGSPDLPNPADLPEPVKQFPVIEPRQMTPSRSAPFATIDLSSGKDDPVKKMERRKNRENQERALEIFLNSHVPREEDELARIFVYQKDKKDGRDFYSPLDPKDALEEVRAGRRDLDQIFVRKSVAHSRGLGFHMKEIPIEDHPDGMSLVVPVKRHASATAKAVHETLVEAGVINPLNMESFEGCTVIRIDTEDESGLFQAASEFFDGHSEVLVLEKELEFQCREAREMLRSVLDEGAITLEQYVKELDLIYVQLKEEFQEKFDTIQRRAELAKSKLQTDEKYTTLAQPGEFLFERTFNQGHFVSLEKLLEERTKNG